MWKTQPMPKLSFIVALLVASMGFFSFPTLPLDGPAAPQPALAEGSQAQPLEMLAQVGGMVFDAVGREGMAVVGVGPRLQIWDLRVPGKPSMLGQTEVLGGLVNSLLMADNLVYVAAATAGLVIVDIQDPAQPTLLAVLDTPGYASDLTISGQTLYLADGEAGVRIVDVTNPWAPRELGAMGSGDEWVHRVVASDALLFVATAIAVRVLDVTDKAAPRVLSSLPLVNVSVTGLAIQGSRAYIAGWGVGFYVVDLQDPAQPTLVGTLKLKDPARDVVVQGSLAYLALEGGLMVVDISDPAQPHPLALVPSNQGWLNRLSLVGQTVHASAGYGLSMFDLSEPAAPRLAAEVPVMTFVSDVMLKQGLAFLVTGAGIEVFDIADQVAPKRIALLEVPGGVQGMFIRGNLAYVTSGNVDPRRRDGSLWVYDLTNPGRPAALGSVTLGGPGSSGTRLTVVDNMAYIVGEWLGLYLVDVSDPTQPQFVSYTRIKENPVDLAVAGNTVYVAAQGDGVHVIDVTDPAHPVDGGSLDSSFYANGVAVSGNTLYVAGDASLLRLIDISDPGKPQSLSDFHLPTGGFSVHLDGDIAYVGAYDGGLRVVQVTDPSQPWELAYLDTAGETTHSSVTDGVIAIADGTGGLVLARPRLTLPTPTAMLTVTPTATASPSPASSRTRVYIPQARNR